MAWIESHQSLGRHPKTKATARALGISRVQVVGHLHYLWWWALDYAEDGDLSAHDVFDIAEEAMWDGDPHAFVDGLMAGGFITADMQISDWDDYTGMLRQGRDIYREANRERQRRYRERQKAAAEAEKPASNVTDNVTVTPRNGPTIPNHTEPNPTEQDHTHTNGASAPEVRVASRSNYTDSFEQFWRAYPSGHGVKKTAFEQWKKLKPDDLTQRRIMAGLERWKTCDRWQRGFVKSAHIWLRERWWENEPPPPANSEKGNGKSGNGYSISDLMRMDSGGNR